MFHDESVGEKKLTLVVVKVFIKKDGVRLTKAVDHSLRPPPVGLPLSYRSISCSAGGSGGRLHGQSVGQSVGRSVGRSVSQFID